jgi:hypothetical protein
MIETASNSIEYDIEKIEKEINAVIEDSKKELNILNALVGEKNVLENLSSENLSKYLKHQVFEGDTVKSYSEISNIDGINTILLSALQRIAETDANKYNENWKIDADNWKTIKDFLKLQSSFGSKWIRFLQWIVWAYPDGKAWPQTIALLLDKLWDPQANENMVKVNNFYANNDQFKIDKIQTATIWDKTYNYNKSEIEIQPKDGLSGAYQIKKASDLTRTDLQIDTIESSWFKVQDWIIMLDTPEGSWSEEAETSIYWKEELIKKFALEKADSKILLRGIDAQQYFWIKSDLYKRAKDNWIYFFDWNILKRVELTSCYVEKYKWKDTWEKEYPPESAFFKHYLNGALTDTLRKNKIPVDDKSIIYKDNRYYIKSFGKETQIQLDTLTGWRIVKWSSKEVLWQNLQLINLVNFIDKIKKDKNRFKAWSKFVNRNWNIVVTWYKGHTWDFDIVKQSTWKEKYSFMDKSKTDRFVNYLNSLIVKN